MYLKALYKQNKAWFVLAVLFALAQLVNNIRQDIAFSPVYQYGMYSAYTPPKKIYGIFEVTVAGQVLRPADFSVQQWDRIILPLKYYSENRCNNNPMYEHEIKRLFSKLGITADSSRFTYQLDKDQFLTWYKTYLESCTGKKADSVNISYNLYSRDSAFHRISINSFGELCK